MGMRTADDTIAGSHQRHAIFSKLFAASELSLREDVKPERQTDFALVPGTNHRGFGIGCWLDEISGLINVEQA